MTSGVKDQFVEGDFDGDRQRLVDKRQDGRGRCWDLTVDVATSRPARFTYLALACISIGILMPLWFLVYYPLDVQPPVYTRGSCMIAPQYRFPCLVGDENVTDRLCAEAGCCWYDETGDEATRPASCFHSLPASYTLKLNSSSVNSTELRAQLTAYSFADELAGRAARTPYGNRQRARPWARLFCPEEDHAVLQLGGQLEPADSREIVIDGQLSIRSNVGKDWDFYALVTRNSSGQPLLDTRLGATIVSDLYSELTIVPASRQVYGLGQAFHPQLRRSFDSPVRTTLFAREHVFSEGFHPFYMGIEPDGQVHGVYLETTAPLEVQLLPGPSITLRLVDARLRLHVFAGPTPAMVSEQYTRLVGRPRLPPLWSLGFHLCRQGDDSFADVVDAMVNHSMPFESDCIDADALVPFGFEVADETKDAFRAGADLLHAQGRRVVARSLPQLPLYRQPLGVGSDNYEADANFDDNYEPYVQANVAGLLLRTANDTDNVYGELHTPVGNRTWNVSYVDYSNAATVDWLTPLYAGLLADYDIDGFYLMENAPDNDAVDYCPADVAPFVPHLDQSSSLSNHTVCMSSIHSSGPHLGQHSRYGLDHTSAVRAAVTAAGGSGHLLLTSTSTAPGSGAAGAQLAVGLSADWTSLQLALVQALELGLYGVPQSGYPVCGSLNSTQIAADDERRLEMLCLHWYQLVPYLPLAVSYYEAGQWARNPTQLSEAFVSQVLVHLNQRYVFAPLHFTLLVEASRTGAPPLRPLWYEFPADNATWGIDQQVLLGASLMVAPALSENQRTVNLYLPGQCWYEYFQGYRPKTTVGPAWVNLPVPPQQTLIYQRGASVIFNQQPRTTMEEQRKTGTYSATIALSCEGNYTADGVLYLPGDDAAISPEMVELEVLNTTITISWNLNSTFCDFYAQNGYISILTQIKIFGILEDVRDLNAVLTDQNGTSVYQSLTISQNDRPPSLLIQDLVLDWCIYPLATITWK